MVLALVLAAPVVVWDSKVQDGYKRNQAPAAKEEESGSGPKGCWDGRRSGGVVEELLKNSSDTAYGAPGQPPLPATPFLNEHLFIYLKTHLFQSCDILYLY